MLLLLFGRTGMLAPLTNAIGLKIAFALPGMILATLFVTLPFMVRELMPVLAAFALSLTDFPGADRNVAYTLVSRTATEIVYRATAHNLEITRRYSLAKAPGDDLQAIRESLLSAAAALDDATTWVAANVTKEVGATLAGSAHYLRLCGLALGAYVLAKGALTASQKLMSRDGDPEVYANMGRTMTVKQLAYHMITTSSNFATNLLVDVVGVETVQAALRELGIDGVTVLRGVEDQAAYEAGLNNEVTANGLMKLLRLIAEGRAFSPEACADMLEILLDQLVTERCAAPFEDGPRLIVGPNAVRPDDEQDVGFHRVPVRAGARLGMLHVLRDDRGEGTRATEPGGEFQQAEARTAGLDGGGAIGGCACNRPA